MNISRCIQNEDIIALRNYIIYHSAKVSSRYSRRRVRMTFEQNFHITRTRHVHFVEVPVLNAFEQVSTWPLTESYMVLLQSNKVFILHNFSKKYINLFWFSFIVQNIVIKCIKTLFITVSGRRGHFCFSVAGMPAWGQRARSAEISCTAITC